MKISLILFMFILTTVPIFTACDNQNDNDRELLPALLFLEQVTRLVCDEGFDDCNGDPADRCETSLKTITDCGSCGAPCAADNAAMSCSTGACLMESCNNGWCDLNGDVSDGCEMDLDTDPSCVSYTDIGSVSGDEGSDKIDYYNRGEKWYRLNVLETYEDSTNSIYLSAIIVLTPPAGGDYDLAVYCDNCTASAGSSSNSGSVSDTVGISWDEEEFMGFPSGSNSGRYIYILVKFWSANTCDDYHLEVFGNQAVDTRTCSTL